MEYLMMLWRKSSWGESLSFWSGFINWVPDIIYGWGNVHKTRIYSLGLMFNWLSNSLIFYWSMVCSLMNEVVEYALILVMEFKSWLIEWLIDWLFVYFQVKVGFCLNILCILVITMGIHTWGMAYFNLDELPWAVENSTVTSAFSTLTTQLIPLKL